MADTRVADIAEPTGFLEGLLGRRASARSMTDRQVAGLCAALGALLYLPFLGAVGLWDPWETHYAEVARSMIVRRDFVYPYWESGWFFSKPPLTMWLQALGMMLVGTQRTSGALGLYTEWGVRLPFALLSIATLAGLGYVGARLAGARVGLLAAFVLGTMPQYFLITRQSVTDTPFVTTATLAFCCGLLALLDTRSRSPDAWWYATYALCGISVLAKGLLGLLPLVVLGLYVALCRLPWTRGEWLRAAGQQLVRMRLLPGLVLLLAIAAPWYVALILFDGVDDEGKLFWYRFFIHDHLNRLGAGVHTTTPGGTFVYFIEQAGYALFPWVALAPGAIAAVVTARLRDPDPRAQLGAAATLWTVAVFGLVALSATKFHHYLLPVLPGLALLIALYGDRLWREGLSEHAGSLLLGGLLLVLVAKDLLTGPTPNDRGNLAGGFKNFTDLFVYNYDRPYPAELLTRPIRGLAGQALRLGDLVGGVLFAAGSYWTAEAHLGSDRRPALRAAGAWCLGAGLAILLGGSGARGSLGVPLIVGGAAAGAYAAWLWAKAPKGARAAPGLALAAAGALAAVGALAGEVVASALAGLVSLRDAIGFAFGVVFLLLLAAVVARSIRMLSAVFVFATLAFALWFNWAHWVDLSHHWTQRDLFWRYYDKRAPDEPIAAYLMNWRGETFYSRNTVEQIPLADANRRLQSYVAPPGREWALVEQARLAALRNAVSPAHQVTVVDRDLNIKFVLVAID